MTMSPKLRLGKVAYGRAILCTQPIAEGESIFDLVGRLVRVPAMHTLQIDEHSHLDPDDASWAMINHSCSPNCVIDLATRRVIASRAISPGEELTFNYLTTEWDMATPFPCTCGSAHCPGWIRGFRFLDAAQRAAIASGAAPYLMRLASRDAARERDRALSEDGAGTR